MGRLEGRVALVTGAARGIGLAAAERLACEGATVVATDVDAEAGRAAADRIGATFLRHDVADEAQWQAVVAAVRERHGALHAVVNNAGIEGDPEAAKDPEHAPLADWNRIFAVNAGGVFLGCKHTIPLLAQSGGGSIVNVASVATLVPTPFITAYGAAKSAVVHLTQSVALHCAQAGHRIRCNSVHPGQVNTPMLQGLFARFAAQAGVSAEAFGENFRQTIPLGAYQEPADIAAAILFLVSDESRYVTGQALAVDGGYALAH